VRLPLALVLLACSLQACTIVSQRYSTPQIQAISLQKGDLERGGVAFLTPSTVTGQEEDRQPLALVFGDTLAAKRKDVRIVSLAATLSAVNRAGMTEAYKRMYQDSRDSGVFEPALLRQIGEITGTRYAVQLKMAGFRQDNKGRFGVFGLSVVQTQTANIRLFLQIWDTHSGTVAWEGTEEYTGAVDTITERTVTFKSVIEASASDLIDKLP
jgi:hypothetical protein